jgi:hypothetical protein
VHQHALLAVGGARLGEAVDDALLVVDVDLAEQAADRLRDLGALGFVDVEDRDLDAGGGQRLADGLAQAGRAAGDDCADAGIEFHGKVSCGVR